MNSQQDKALADLSAAFKKCKLAKISFCGMDNNLLAYDRDLLRAAEKRIGCLHGAQDECGQGEVVNTHETYLDSGGW